MPILTRSARRLSRPTLPTELVDQILQDPELGQADLARCCRVSQKFLSIARPTLYHNIDILFFTADIGRNGGGDWCLNEISARFFDCLSANPTIARYTRTITVSGEYSEMLEYEDCSDNSGSESDGGDGTESGSEEASSSEYDDPTRLAKKYYGETGQAADCTRGGAEVFPEAVDAVEFCIRMLPHLETLIVCQDLQEGLQGLMEGEGSEWRISNVEKGGRCGCKHTRFVRRLPLK